MISQPENVLTYVHLRLSSKYLDEKFRTRLAGQGVECLDDAGDYEAYGIIELSESVLGHLRDDPDVLEVEVREPPTSK